jgi:hypothetical protein
MEVFLALGEDEKNLTDIRPTGTQPAIEDLMPATKPHVTSTTIADQPR